MSQVVTIELDLPADLAQFRLPAALNARLSELLDRQDSGVPLKDKERHEAEGLVELAEMLTLLRLRAEAAIRRATTADAHDVDPGRIAAASCFPRR